VSPPSPVAGAPAEPFVFIGPGIRIEGRDEREFAKRLGVYLDQRIAMRVAARAAVAGSPGGEAPPSPAESTTRAMDATPTAAMVEKALQALRESAELHGWTAFSDTERGYYGAALSWLASNLPAMMAATPSDAATTAQHQLAVTIHDGKAEVSVVRCLTCRTVRVIEIVGGRSVYDSQCQCFTSRAAVAPSSEGREAAPTEATIGRVRADKGVQAAFANVAMRVALDCAGMGLDRAIEIGADFGACATSNDTNRGESADLLIREILRVMESQPRAAPCESTPRAEESPR